MISFLEKEEKIKKYFSDNLPTYATEIGLSGTIIFIDDFMDLDKYKNNIQLFFDFSDYNFNALSNESNDETIKFSVYLVLKGATSTTLLNTMRKYAAAIYEMFEQSGENFNGSVDYGKCTNVVFYPAAEGNINVKALEVDFELHDETN